MSAAGGAEYPVVVDATVKDNPFVPSWGDFACMYLLWPFLIQLLISAVLFIIKLSRCIRVRQPRPQANHKRNHDTRSLKALVAAVQLLLSTAEVVMYVDRTHRPTWIPGDAYMNVEIAFAVVFAVGYLYERVLVEFKPSSAWSVGAIVDVLTIVPVFLPFGSAAKVPVMQRWVSTRYLRSVRVLQAIQVANDMMHVPNLSDFFRQLLMVMLQVFVSVVCMAGTVFNIEVLGEISGIQPTTVRTNMGDLSFVQMNYWIITTMSTVGYGDYSPTTQLSQIVVVCFIFVGVIFFGSETAVLADLKWSLDEGYGRYSAKSGHIVITGSGSNAMSPMLETLIYEILQGGGNDDRPLDVVVLSDEAYDPTMLNFAKRTLNAKFRHRLKLLRGNCRSVVDMQRVELSQCLLALILPSIGGPDPRKDDEHNILGYLDMNRAMPHVRLRLMMSSTSSEKRALDLGVPRQHCFALDGMKAAILAHSVRIKGFVTMLSGIVEVATASDCRKSVTGDYAWQDSYAEGVEKAIYGFIVSAELVGMTFANANARVYSRSKGHVMLLAAQDEGSLFVNWTGTLMHGQVLIALASEAEACKQFADESAGDWRVRAKQNAEDGARQSVGLGESPLFVQAGGGAVTLQPQRSAGGEEAEHNGVVAGAWRLGGRLRGSPEEVQARAFRRCMCGPLVLPFTVEVGGGAWGCSSASASALVSVS